MPHHHNRHVHLHARQGVWDQFTSAAASVWNDAFPTATTGNKANDSGDSPATIYRTVYTTMTPSGWTGTALSTIAPAQESTSTTTVRPTTTPTATSKDTLETTSATPKSTTPSNTSLPAVITSTSESVPSTLVVASTTKTPSSFGQQTGTTSAASAASATSSANATSSSSGPSAGAKAGIAFGVLGGILVVFLALYFLFTRRRKQMEEKRRADDDEKRNGPFADTHAIPGTPSTSAKAPRLSLRPVTQFLPNLGNQAHPDRRASRGAAIPMTLSPTQNTSRALTGTAMNPPSTSSSAHSANPFGNNAERIYSPIPEESTRAVSPVSPIESEVGTAITTNSPPRTSPAVPASNANMAAGAAVGLARKASMRKDNAPKPLDLTRPMALSAVPPSPAGTEFSMHSVSPGQSPGPSSSAAAIEAAGGPAQSAVHRVQLDFKPTLEDEMELRAGQLVRMLHEYDDGWALCIRLDRSKQGVVPRTCLSTRPVKPRPAPGAGRPGPPINPNRGPGYPPANRPQGAPHGGSPYARPGSAQSGRQSPSGGPPMGPYGGRPQSPAGMRPMSPAYDQRSQSPGPRYQQGRPQSPSGMQRRMSPPGQSPMNQEYQAGPPTGPVGRKPVPGQAS
ncbi:hypothetical protein CONLIGDRAFT_370804 [Coniochaeta ligniaria NRRL 30616]|uniref:SH3 domain-containing protein n=1 Tax=Coniochaeta ligniaria NRRL 30616 TaxID=1408157 RepID=A0A1J7IL30_9PEZI|nr:hypothetical protein CONLIGDRAFT_370804 [Coniochaeta ligniaria NRRL 30616]